MVNNLHSHGLMISENKVQRKGCPLSGSAHDPSHLDLNVEGGIKNLSLSAGMSLPVTIDNNTV